MDYSIFEIDFITPPPNERVNNKQKTFLQCLALRI